jgi:hypothetical protein
MRPGRIRSSSSRGFIVFSMESEQGMAPDMLIYLVFRRKAPADDLMRGSTSPTPPAIISATDVGAFISPSTVGLRLLSRCHPRTRDNYRKPATECDFDHRDLFSPVR